jgi:predicted secreted protein
MLNVTAFSIEETSETIDTTSMGDASREIVATFKGFSGTVDGYWDIDDAAIGHDDSPTAPVVTAGDKIDFEVYPGGLAVANLAVYKGSAIVTSISRSQSFDGVTEYSMTFEGTGDLSYDKTPTP